MPLISAQLVNDPIKAGVRLFVLGMVDKLRQAHQFSWDEFIAICTEIFKENELLPNMPMKEFLNEIQNNVADNEDLAKIMRVSAQSIQMYVSERDAQAPMDLISVPQFVKGAESSFEGIAA